MLGISRAFAYEAVNKGEVPSIRIGRRILVPKVALERMLGAEGTPGGGPAAQYDFRRGTRSPKNPCGTGFFGA